MGDAHNDAFLDTLLEKKWDVIVDFMSYSTLEFEARYKKMLDSTGQYVFLSSARVFSDKDEIISEDTPRLLDVCHDKDYLISDEYALAKARQENKLLETNRNNYTIVRPYITYNWNRFQLGTLEKEYWLSRVLLNKKVVFWKDIAGHYTTMTYGEDVSKAIYMLLDNKKAYGEAFNITGEDWLKWSDIISIYTDVIEEIIGVDMEVYYEENSHNFVKILNNTYQVKYDRLYDRKFDNSKIISACGNALSFVNTRSGLREAIKKYKKHDLQIETSLIWEAYCNRLTKEKSGYEFGKKRIIYCLYRYMPTLADLLLP